MIIIPTSNNNCSIRRSVLFQVNFGSLAEKAGLQVGDALVRVNDQEVYDVKHKDAQDVILGAGNAFELTIQRYRKKIFFLCVTIKIKSHFES